MAYDKEDVYAILGDLKDRLNKLEERRLSAPELVFDGKLSEYILMGEMFPGGPSEKIGEAVCATADEALKYFSQDSFNTISGLPGVVYVRVGGQ